ncbi:MAG: DUF3842 family protein [Firmicutes bacterium]|nr:DUF3842 family protein [Bacillota bacterium]
MKNEKKPVLVVIDGQGGKIGKELCTQLINRFPETEVWAIGTNSLATSFMLKAKPHQAATGENPVIVACREADIICGPIGICIADSMLGEVTPKMALAISQSRARKVLIPFNKCSAVIAGVKEATLAELIEDALNIVEENL